MLESNLSPCKLGNNGLKMMIGSGMYDVTIYVGNKNIMGMDDVLFYCWRIKAQKDSQMVIRSYNSKTNKWDIAK